MPGALQTRYRLQWDGSLQIHVAYVSNEFEIRIKFFLQKILCDGHKSKTALSDFVTFNMLSNYFTGDIMIYVLHTKIMICMLVILTNSHTIFFHKSNEPFWFLLVCFSGVEGGRELVKWWVLSYLYHWFILNSTMLS
jgi:hypothetical protein